MASLAFGYISCLKNLFSLFWESKSPRYMFFQNQKEIITCWYIFCLFSTHLLSGTFVFNVFAPVINRLSTWTNMIFPFSDRNKHASVLPLTTVNMLKLHTAGLNSLLNVQKYLYLNNLLNVDKWKSNGRQRPSSPPPPPWSQDSSHCHPPETLGHNLSQIFHLVRILAIRSATSPRLDLSDKITKWRWLPGEGNFIAHARELLIEANNEEVHDMSMNSPE